MRWPGGCGLHCRAVRRCRRCLTIHYCLIGQTTSMLTGRTALALSLCLPSSSPLFRRRLRHAHAQSGRTITKAIYLQRFSVLAMGPVPCRSVASLTNPLTIVDRSRCQIERTDERAAMFGADQRGFAEVSDAHIAKRHRAERVRETALAFGLDRGSRHWLRLAAHLNSSTLGICLLGTELGNISPLHSVDRVRCPQNCQHVR